MFYYLVGLPVVALFWLIFPFGLLLLAGLAVGGLVQQFRR